MKDTGEGAWVGWEGFQTVKQSLIPKKGERKKMG